MNASQSLNALAAAATPWLRKSCITLAAALTWGVSTQALADAECIPQAYGVPALSGAPNFLDTSAGEPSYWPRLDDPRWRGAATRSFGTGASELASFRVLRSGGASPALYMSWYVKVDPSLDPYVDSLRVAISSAAGSGEMIEVIPFTTLATNLNAAVPPLTQTRLLSAGSWTNTPAEPTWLAANTRVWLDVANQQWAINMRLPIAAGFDSGINLPAEFRVAFELAVSTPGGGMVYHRLSDSVPLNNLSAVPASTSWPAFNIALAPGAVGCNKGVSLAASDVGTTNVDAAAIPRPNRISLGGANTFFALPNNDSGATVAASQIAGTFRIANWGTQPDWNDIPNPTTSLWKQLNSTLVTNASSIATGSKASIAAGNALTFNWTPTAGERCEFTGQVGISAAQSPDGVAIPGNPACPNVNPTRRLHQCMLVDLSGGGLSYNPASVYRNMDFVEASSFEREAEVSLAGLPALGGGAPKRDVYLYVQKQQMPRDIKVPQPPLTLVNYAKVQSLPKGTSTTYAATVSEVPARPPLGGSFDTLNQIYPTYIVHAFHDTGNTVLAGGQLQRVLKPQSSFGYYVHHDGALTGWDTALVGAQEIAPNYYRIAVPEGGTATVTTRVRAREQALGQFAVELAVGGTFPHGNFDNNHDGGLSTMLGLEYSFTPNTSVEAVLGGHRFDGTGGAASVDVTQFGVNGKWYFQPQPLRWFATAGVGNYQFSPGSNRTGITLGAGLQYEFAPQWSLEGRYGWHSMVDNAGNTDFSTLHLGLRYAF